MKRLALIPLALMMAGPALAADAGVRSVTVSGMAERKVVPDEAHITVNLNAMDKKMATARAAHDEKLGKLMEIVRSAGIDDKKVRTESSNISPVYHYDNDAKGKSVRSFDGYRVQTNIDITVADTKKLGGLMEKISSAGFEEGANTEWGNLMSVYYTISDPVKLREDMLTEAMNNAKDKATKLANAAGANIARVYQITEGSTPNYAGAPAPMMMRMAAPGAAPAMAPPAGEQQLESTVTVTYELQ